MREDEGYLFVDDAFRDSQYIVPYLKPSYVRNEPDYFQFSATAISFNRIELGSMQDPRSDPSNLAVINLYQEIAYLDSTIFHLQLNYPVYK